LLDLELQQASALWMSIEYSPVEPIPHAPLFRNSEAVEAIAFDGIPPHELPGLVFAQAGISHELLGRLAGMRERRVSVRVVGLEHDLAHSHDVAARQTVQILENAAEDPVHITAGTFGHTGGKGGLPGVGPLPDEIHPFENERHPAHLALAQSDAQPRESGQDT